MNDMDDMNMTMIMMYEGFDHRFPYADQHGGALRRHLEYFKFIKLGISFSRIMFIAWLACLWYVFFEASPPWFGSSSLELSFRDILATGLKGCPVLC